LKHAAPPASSTCPKCGTELEDDAVICPACDHILDATFLDEAAEGYEDEGTDPRGDVPPDLDDAGTDPGAAPAAALEDEGTDPGGAAGPAAFEDEGTDPGAMMPTMVGDDLPADDATQMGPAPGPPDEDDDSMMKTLAGDPDDFDAAPARPKPRKPAMPEAPPPRAPAPPPPPAPPAPPAPRPVPAAPPSRPGASSSAPRNRSSPGTGSAPGLGSASGSATGDGRQQRPSLRERLDFDTSSELMDDYDKFFREAWRRFVAAPVADKIVASGAILALVSVLMPWRIVLAQTGAPEERIGLALGGWLTLLLAIGCLGAGWLRLTKPKANQMHFILAQLGTAGLGLIWTGIGLLGGLIAAASAPENIPVTPGPAYGVFVCGIAWTVVLVGGLLGLKDLGGRPRRR
jgi:hypothetical protein